MSKKDAFGAAFPASGDGIAKIGWKKRKPSDGKAPPRKRQVDAASPLDEDVYKGLAGFRFALRRFLAFSEVAASAVGMTSQQYQALLAIKVHPDQAMMIKDIAHQLLLQPNGAVQLVDRLVEAGLAERRPSPSDRRSVLVAMTVQGAMLLESLAADHLREMLKHEPLLAESLRRLRKMGRSSDIG